MEKITEQMLYEFLYKNDKQFPISLSSKCSLVDYASKLIKYGTLCIKVQDSHIIGLVAGYTDNLVDNLAYISIVCVDEQYKKIGVATKLILEFIEICKRKNIANVHLYTDSSNFGAIRLYEKLGFKRYFPDNETRNSDIHFIKLI